MAPDPKLQAACDYFLEIAGRHEELTTTPVHPTDQDATQVEGSFMVPNIATCVYVQLQQSGFQEILDAIKCLPDDRLRHVVLGLELLAGSAIHNKDILGYGRINNVAGILRFELSRRLAEKGISLG